MRGSGGAIRAVIKSLGQMLNCAVLGGGVAIIPPAHNIPHITVIIVRCVRYGGCSRSPPSLRVIDYLCGCCPRICFNAALSFAVGVENKREIVVGFSNILVSLGNIFSIPNFIDLNQKNMI